MFVVVFSVQSPLFLAPPLPPLVEGGSQSLFSFHQKSASKKLGGLSLPWRHYELDEIQRYIPAVGKSFSLRAQWVK